ncbi:MAG: HdeA/HdeB family chaperone [Sedimenticolaceae bacterium]|jgi:hypothetical protein
MSKLIRSLIPVAFFALPLLHAPAGAAEGEVVDMSAYLCKDVMRMSDEERDVTLGVLHGYMLGRKGATSFVSDDLAKVSDEFVEYCLDNPYEKAMASFEKLAK